MGYYSGVIEHDTGVHADAEQQVAGQQMMRVEITLSEYRDLVAKNAKADYLMEIKKSECKEFKQKLYDALKAIDENKPMTDAQKEEFRKLCGDWEVKKN